MPRRPDSAFKRSIKTKLVLGTAAIVLGVVTLLTFVTARPAVSQDILDFGVRVLGTPLLLSRSRTTVHHRPDG